jgi:hypothetical protein
MAAGRLGDRETVLSPDENVSPPDREGTVIAEKAK